ncbi:MAG: pentapeptide repeat-containing protein [Thermosynechococcaceae cyanobacterium]
MLPTHMDMQLTQPVDDLEACDRVPNMLAAFQQGQRDFAGINLENADLSGANLAGINLSRANLRGANLSGTILTNANLQRVDFQCANLSQADLCKANLSEAKLDAANLHAAILIRAISFICKAFYATLFELLSTDLCHLKKGLQLV